MEQVLSILIEQGKMWVRSQRELHRPLAKELDPSVRERLDPYFKPDSLDTVRRRAVPSIENPAFYAEFEKAGQRIPLDFRAMSGITFMDTILIAESKVAATDLVPLVFHECVHAFQYRVLGVDAFVEQYINGWASNGFDYFSIPLERQAYDLQRRFELERNVSFSVEREVVVRLGTAT